MRGLVWLLSSGLLWARARGQGLEGDCGCANLDSCYEALETIARSGANRCQSRCQAVTNVNSAEVLSCYTRFHLAMQNRLKIEYDCQVENGVCRDPLRRRIQLFRSRFASPFSVRVKRNPYHQPKHAYHPQPSYHQPQHHGYGHQQQQGYHQPQHHGYGHQQHHGGFGHHFGYKKKKCHGYHCKKKCRGYGCKKKRRKKKKKNKTTTVAPPAAPTTAAPAIPGTGTGTGAQANPLVSLGDLAAFDSCYRQCLLSEGSGGRLASSASLAARHQTRRLEAAEFSGRLRGRGRSSNTRRSRARMFAGLGDYRRAKRQASPRLQTILAQCANVDLCQIGVGNPSCRDVQPSVIQLEAELRNCRDAVRQRLDPLA